MNDLENKVYEEQIDPMAYNDMSLCGTTETKLFEDEETEYSKGIE